MKRRTSAAASVLLVLLVLASGTYAQTGGGYDLTWFSIDGGGTTASSGGTFTLGGTIGQSDAGLLNGGGLALRGGFWAAADPTPTSTATVTPTATATPTRTPTATATPMQCTPWPNVGVAAVANGDGRLRVTITANTNAGAAPNLLQSLQFTRLDNAVVEIGSQVGVTGTYMLPTPAASLTLYVRRATAEQATTVELTVTDTCGTWPTFVGGGPTAF